MNTETRRGTALLLSLAVLAVLSMLAISFIRTTSTERTSASNFAIQVRASMNAEAGINRAIGALQELPIQPYSDPTKDNWVFRTDDGKALGYYPSTDLVDSKFPSLPYDKDGDGNFENGVGGANSDDLVHGRSVSGVIAGIGANGTAAGASGITYGREPFDADGFTYKLKIRDTSSKLNINAKQTNLATLLNLVGKAIEEVELFDPIAGRGTDIVAFRDGRPSGILRELDELVGLLTADEVRYLEAYLCCYSWEDSTTVKPDPHEDPKILPATVAEKRNPVNINTAPEPLIKALISDLKGYEFTFVEQETVYKGTAAVIDEKEQTTPISWTQAGLIAKEILKSRQTTPFKTWEQFKTFVLALPSKTGLSGLTAGQLDVLRANFNPNTLVSRFNPQRVRAHKVSKFDLTRYSTEFCFGPSGYFEIECIGLVTARKGLIVARARHTAVVQVADIIRHTSQAQFESNGIASTRTATYPESITDLVSSGTLHDGQIEMLEKPAVENPADTSTYCIRVTSSLNAKVPSNQIVNAIPDAIIDSVISTVINNKGWNTVKENHAPKTGTKGFKFAPGVLAAKSLESVEYCFTIPASSITTLMVETKIGSPTSQVTLTLDPPDFTPQFNQEGFKVQLLSATNKDVDGKVVSTLPPKFHAPYVETLDARVGGNKLWFGDGGVRKKKEGVSVFAGSSLLPDGMLSLRGLAEELSYKATTNLGLEKGAVEFWVKMVGDGTTGSNEALMYVVHPTAFKTNGELSEGVINKMIRYEDEIINSRAYVGHPDGVQSPYALSYTESIADIGDWKDHEWHHIAMSWFEFVDHRLYVDGVLITNKTTATSAQHTFKLGSNEPIDQFNIGGFEFFSPNGATIFNRGTIIVKGQNERFSNSTISDVQAYNTETKFPPSNFSVDDRFIANPAKPTVWRGKFVLTPKTGVTIGSVSWTEYKPKIWKTTTVDPGDTDIEVTIKILGSHMPSGSSDYTKTIKAGDAGDDGSGAAIEKTLTASSGGTDPRIVEYTLTFVGTVDPLNVTPSLDDIQLIFTIPAQVIIWKRH